MIVSISFAFVIMMITTKSIKLSLSAIFCVLMTISSVTAIMVINGQQLGVSESMSVGILIGFSIDYVIHYSADYIYSKEATRELKM